MPESEKTKLTLVKGGVTTFEDYKRMMNAMSQSLLGHPLTATDKELKREYERFKEEAAKSKDDEQDRSKK